MKHIPYLLVMLFLAVTEHTAAQDKFKLGVIIGLSGSGAEVGQGCQNGISFAYDSLEEGIKRRLEILYEDDQFQPKNTVFAFSKLTSVNKIDAGLTVSSGTSKAVASIAEKKNIPLIAIASDPTIVQGKSSVFNFWVTPATQATILTNEMKKRGYKRIARISTLQDGAISIAKAFDDANKDQIEVIFDESVASDVKDFRTYIAKLKTLNDLDAVFVNLFFGQPGTFAKQARELRVEVPLFGIEFFEDSSEVKSSNGALVGQWYVQADDASSHFKQEYLKKFPGASTYIAGNCHDSLLLIAEALRQGKDGSDLALFLKNIKNFQGSLGTFSATGDNRFTLPATVKIVTENGFEKVSPG